MNVNICSSMILFSDKLLKDRLDTQASIELSVGGEVHYGC